MKTETLALLEDMSDSELEKIAEIIYQKLANKLGIEDCDCQKEIKPNNTYMLPAIGGGFTTHPVDDEADETEVQIELPQIPVTMESIDGISLNKALISIVEDITASISQAPTTLVVENIQYNDVTKEICFTTEGKTIRCASYSKDEISLDVSVNGKIGSVIVKLEEGDSVKFNINEQDYIELKE